MMNFFFHICSLDSQDEETEIFVAKEQRRFAHSAAEQKRRDAIRVSWCYFILFYDTWFVYHGTVCIIGITCGMFECLNMITYSLPSVGFHCCSEIWSINIVVNVIQSVILILYDPTLVITNQIIITGTDKFTSNVFIFFICFF